MFYGEYEHSLDKKGRIIVPSVFRDILKERYADKLFIARGLDRCLFLFTEDEWKALEKKFKELSFTKQGARNFNRIFFSGSCEVICDKQGRVLIPQTLKAYAEIKENVVIVGVSDRIEIWAKEKWQEFINNSMNSFEDLAEKLLDSNPGKDHE